MKKILLSFLTTTLMSGALFATEDLNINSYANELQQMQKFLDTMVSSHLTPAKIVNIGYPRVDIKENNTTYTYEFDLAGVPKENIQLSIDENNILAISGVKESKHESKTDKYIKQEIYYGSFSRTLKLPEDIDQNRVETKYDNGILSVTIGKKELKKPKAKILEIK